MNIKEIRSDVIYREIVQAPAEDRAELYRNKLLGPFETKYKYIGVPLKAEKSGGYDAVSVTVAAGGYVPASIDENVDKSIDMISREDFWNKCTDSIRKVLDGFTSRDIVLPVQDYIYTILLNDPANPASSYTGKTCGDGGIPGYIIGTIIPDEEAVEAMQAVLAHETNHNVRWQFMKWSNKITLADMVVSEGLAENQTAFMYGEDKIGQWARCNDRDQFNSVIIPLIHDHLYENDFMKVSTYLYGDDIMKARGGMPLGVPYCAGYLCGYELVKHYLNRTGKSIYEASVMPTSEIIKESEDFWK